ncbi:hypothetical protein Z968_10005 [Clostridium novyi A str. 4552]|uniref:Putative component of 'biosynthetic module' domain-containing protein n=1 Tax=Clostridium novyi A str. 4552 TaxID=1444289 RepID=A0A0A0I449_CLONO|nr:YceG family protein [Clostridium novyi]KGM95086.1 hypothetical protein Z968_10005 [Clostridium novyi A str. 4552]
MININKFIHSSLTSSKDVFNDILTPLNKRNGFINGQSPIVPIYFYRYVGFSDKNNYYERINMLNNNLKSFKCLYTSFLDEIPLENNIQITNSIQNLFNKLKIEIINEQTMTTLAKNLLSNNFLPKFNDILINSSIETALIYILNLYISLENSINLTKIKNFSIKLSLWIYKFLSNLLIDFHIPKVLNSDIINPKVLYIGNIKKHEVLFLIFLSKIGCDVLYLNPQDEGDFLAVDPNCNYSNLISEPNREPLDMTKLNINKSEKFPIINNCIKSKDNITSSLKPLDENYIKSSNKTSTNIFEDILLSLNERGSFIGGSIPNIPCYFYRYIGIQDNEDEYFNNLYRLDKHLEGFHSLYVKFLNEIPIENNIDIINKTSAMWNKLSSIEQESPKNVSINLLLEYLINFNAFPDLREKCINSSIVKSFYKILELYIINEKNINLSKIKNFTLKILMWIYRYIPNLFKGFDYLKTSNSDIYNPKILYYGNIKKHEAYFLIFLSLMGCDVLYVNSQNDSSFLEVDKNNAYSNVTVLPNLCAIREFPKEELLTRHETVAFKASNEIENVIYNEEDGLFKPWQFEDYKTSPLTLRATYDELKLLWNEEARIRSGFKIENGTVYIPNLFAKISGVNSDLNLYWNDLKTLKNAKDTLFIYKIPHKHDDYSNYDLYSLSYCFKNGVLDKENLLKHRLYKFSYLKTPLQNVIIDKINLLLKLPIFKNSVDDEFKLKILITILNIDKDILELIQKFDYPFSIPKIVMYHNNENLLSDSDIIVLTFLNIMCFDIAIFTPTGYNDIETNINESFYDIHKLENIKFNLNIPNLNSIKKIKDRSGSFWSNLFK